MSVGSLLKVKKEEIAIVLWSFVYFFCLLCSYYILRPVRDEMGIRSGLENLQWVFTATFITMLLVIPLFGFLVRSFPRKYFLPLVYCFFIVNLLLFYVFFKFELSPINVARIFFVWISVFNLFVVSVFWSFMAELFNSTQARRLFGLIAAGGSAGAILGPTITALFAKTLGTANLILISSVFLGIALLCINRLNYLNLANTKRQRDENSIIGGGLFAGLHLLYKSPYLLAISAFIFLYTFLSTFLYFEQAHIVKSSFDDSAQRTAVFAIIDLIVNILTVGMQLFITNRLVLRFGISSGLAIIPFLLFFGFIILGISPTLWIILGLQIIRRAGNYAFSKPVREMLFTVVSNEEKYKAKNVIDTVIYRGGDALSAWIFAGFTNLGMGLSSIAFIAAPITIVWISISLLLGKWNTEKRVDMKES